MKDKILKLIDKEIGAASDNVARAERAFSGMSDQEMQEQHGQSFESRQSILDGYVNWRSEYQQLREWGVANIPSGD